MSNIDQLDKQLINLLQIEFPLTKEPYATLGLHLGITGSEVISRIKCLKSNGIIRLISPVLDARSLGYQTTLVAMNVAKDKLDIAEQIIARHPGVSHGYERDHNFNVWFTMAVPSSADLELELRQLTNPIEAENVFSLPAIRVFKIGTYFNMGEDEHTIVEVPSNSENRLAEEVELSAQDKLIIKELQQDLPLVPMPFMPMSERAGMEVEIFLKHCRFLLQRGIMRRYGASINHNKAGYKANAMTCWSVPSDKVDFIGRDISHLRQVSHCYERRTNPLWRYNLFAMVHSRSRDECQELVNEVSHRIGIPNYLVLFSTKEFKKTRVKYQI